MRQFLVVALAWLTAAGPAQAADTTLTFGRAVAALNGPWKFQTGDDLSWATPDWDDSQWETVDLTPAPDSHDGDVGLKNYVPGWAARGHPGYSGFAWYRLSVSASANDAGALWLVGPADVNGAYQVYLNGHFVGGIGDFTRKPPTVIAIQPRLFELPRAWWIRDGAQLRGVVAFRVAQPKGVGLAADGGGIHIAPLIGTTEGASDHYRLEWLQTLEGYTVDAVEPFFFWCLAIMALCLLPFEPGQKFIPWLAASLGFVGLARLNQPLFFLGQFETYREFALWRLVIVDALTFGTWTMAWLYAFVRAPPRWTALSCAGLTVLYAIARTLRTSVLIPSFSPGAIHVSADVLQAVRLGFLALLLYAAWHAVLRRRLADYVGLLAVVLASVGLFASELSILGVPGIWFPYGVGVSRTEYAYAVFYPVLFLYLLLRLWAFAPAGRRPGVPA